MNNNDDKETAKQSESLGIAEQNRIRARAIRILGNRQMSSNEIERRLLDKGESEEAAKETTEWLERIGAINDVEYAAAIVRHYTEKSYGMARIKNELFRRGIPREMWDDAIECSEEPDEAVDEYLDRKLRGSRDKDELRRAVNALCRRGFSYDDARSAVSRYLENTEESE